MWTIAAIALAVVAGIVIGAVGIVLLINAAFRSGGWWPF